MPIAWENHAAVLVPQSSASTAVVPDADVFNDVGAAIRLLSFQGIANGAMPGALDFERGQRATMRDDARHCRDLALA